MKRSIAVSATMSPLRRYMFFINNNLPSSFFVYAGAYFPSMVTNSPSSFFVYASFRLEGVEERTELAARDLEMRFVQLQGGYLSIVQSTH
jgi:hypothetical protein